MDSKVSFQRVSLTQATAVDAGGRSASTYVVAAPENSVNLCGCSPTRPPASCRCSKVLAKLLSCLGAAEPGTGPQLPCCCSGPFSRSKRKVWESAGFPKICAGRNFLNVTDHHAHPGVLFRFRETPSLAVPKHHAHPGVLGDHALIPAFRG